MTEMSLSDINGKRKYLSKIEIERFIYYSGEQPLDIKLLCNLMMLTGCRITEALSLTGGSFDPHLNYVMIRCLKKRKNNIYRAIPIPEKVFCQIWAFIHERPICNQKLWPYSRMTAYRKIKSVMEAASIKGVHATPKGLRHAFGVNAIQSGVPIHMVQRWLGHADIKTTAIYANAIGPEERNIAARMWI